MIELALRDRIELVVVTDRATDCQSEPHGSDRFGSIHRISHADLVVDRTTFAGRDVAAIETRCDPLFHRRVRQQVTGELLDRELIEGDVPIERSDDPITIRPERSFVIEMQPVRVAISCRVQPVPREMLAVPSRAKQSLDQFVVRFGRLIRDEGIDFGRSRR